MGYLDNDTIVVDAILTKHGRKILAEGGSINPTHFALSDDGVDYTLWNTSSPSGSSGYDDYITKLPMIEAVPDNTIMMKYTLMSLPQNTRYMPAITLANAPDALNTFELYNDKVKGDEIVLSPQISNYATSGIQSYNYTFYNDTGIKFVDTGGGQMVKLDSNQNAYPQEKNVPGKVKLINATSDVVVTDLTVVADTQCKVLIEHVGTGQLTSALIKVFKATT
jgi:hypothetical protein